MAAKDKNRLLRGSTELQLAALVVLLERQGGHTTYNEAEYQAIAARYGGPSKMAVHTEVVRYGNNAPAVELQLIRKTPANVELVS